MRLMVSILLKYLCAIVYASAGRPSAEQAGRPGDLECIHRRRHVVDPQDAGALLRGRQCCRQAAGQALIDRPARHVADGTLARPADQQRIAQVQQLGLTGQQGEILFGGLGKAVAGIERDALARHARPPQPGGLGRQELPHLRNEVRIVGQVLHRPGLAPHVHQAQARLRMGQHGRQGRLALQRLDVVDDVHAQVQRTAHDLGLAGVHRHRHAQAQSLGQHRCDAPPFLIDAEAQRPGAARLATDIEDVGPLLHQRPAMRDGAARRAVLASVGEGVGRDVDDAHHTRAAQIDLEAGGLPVHGAVLKKQGRK
eukprot:Opistho-2@88954